MDIMEMPPLATLVMADDHTDKHGGETQLLVIPRMAVEFVDEGISVCMGAQPVWACIQSAN